MTRIKKVKRETKILKEISRDIREVKKEDNNAGSEESEEENENERFSNGSSMNGFSGTRTAPVLKTENQSQNLERVADTAPASRRITEETSAPKVLYSTDYSARYDNAAYEARREQEQVVRPSVRSAGAIGGLIEQRNADFSDLRRTQNLWKDSGQQNSGSWEPDRINLMNNERKYSEDKIKEDAKLIEKRRRMM